MLSSDIKTTVIEKQLEELETLVSKLEAFSTNSEKLNFLSQLPVVRNFFTARQNFLELASKLGPEGDLAIKSIIAIGQGQNIFRIHSEDNEAEKKFLALVDYLITLEKSFEKMGGIIGYHLEVLRLIKQQLAPPSSMENYLKPEGLFLGDNTYSARQAVRLGIENLPFIGEIYPVGGAGDRLNLKEEKTGTPLPAAALPFLGKSLLEGLLRDVQARELLYYRLYGKQITTPVALMTSSEKNNHAILTSLFEQSRWFGRPSDSFYFFLQPLVPLVTVEGNWSQTAPLKLSLKPGGHGVIWKLAEDQGAFAWLASKKIEKGLVRQINNPLAGTDNAIIALIGMGAKGRKALGFVSCERVINSAEGTNVIIETKEGGSYCYRLTNIEYTDFNARGLKDEPAEAGSPYSAYPTNTNILFIDIPSIRQAIEKCPLPGKLINLKSKVSFIDPEGKQQWVKGGRLETTMQNIADSLVDRFPHRLQKDQFDQLNTFVVFNERAKTISTTKQSYLPGESPTSTPEQAYFDLLNNNRHLFEKKCLYSLPPAQNFDNYIEAGPNCILLFHPGLGPLYSLIQQKIRRGRLNYRSEIQLEIAEVRMENIRVEGSLLISSTNPLGFTNKKGYVQYGHESRCYLENVMIENRGIDYENTKQFWKNDIIRHESVSIRLGEEAEFFAKNVRLVGNHAFEVPDRHRLVLSTHPDGSLIRTMAKIEQPSWQWKYAFDEEDAIQLSFRSHQF